MPRNPSTGGFVASQQQEPLVMRAQLHALLFAATSNSDVADLLGASASSSVREAAVAYRRVHANCKAQLKPGQPPVTVAADTALLTRLVEEFAHARISHEASAVAASAPSSTGSINTNGSDTLSNAAAAFAEFHGATDVVSDVLASCVASGADSNPVVAKLTAAWRTDVKYRRATEQERNAFATIPGQPTSAAARTLFPPMDIASMTISHDGLSAPVQVHAKPHTPRSGNTPARQSGGDRTSSAGPSATNIGRAGVTATAAANVLSALDDVLAPERFDAAPDLRPETLQEAFDIAVAWTKDTSLLSGPRSCENGLFFPDCARRLLTPVPQVIVASLGSDRAAFASATANKLHLGEHASFSVRAIVALRSVDAADEAPIATTYARIRDGLWAKLDGVTGQLEAVSSSAAPSGSSGNFVVAEKVALDRRHIGDGGAKYAGRGVLDLSGGRGLVRVRSNTTTPSTSSASSPDPHARNARASVPDVTALASATPDNNSFAAAPPATAPPPQQQNAAPAQPVASSAEHTGAAPLIDSSDAVRSVVDIANEVELLRPLSLDAIKSREHIREDRDGSLHDVVGIISSFFAHNDVPAEVTARLFGVSMVVGGEKDGKSSLLANILAEPVVFSDPDTATVAPVNYIFRHDPTVVGTEVTVIDRTHATPELSRLRMEELPVKLKEIMTRVRNTVGACERQVSVEVVTSDPTAVIRRAVDLPGLVGDNVSGGFRNAVRDLAQHWLAKWVLPNDARSHAFLVAKLNENLRNASWLPLFRDASAAAAADGSSPPRGGKVASQQHMPKISSSRVHVVLTYGDILTPSYIERQLREGSVHGLSVDDDGLLKWLRRQVHDLVDVENTVSLHVVSNATAVVSESQPYDVVREGLINNRSNAALLKAIEELPTTIPGYRRKQQSYDKLKQIFGIESIRKIANECTMGGVLSQLAFVEQLIARQMADIVAQQRNVKAQLAVLDSRKLGDDIGTCVVQSAAQLLRAVVTGEFSEQPSNPFYPTQAEWDALRARRSVKVRDEVVPRFPADLKPEVLEQLYGMIHPDGREEPTFPLLVRLNRCMPLLVLLLMLPSPKLVTAEELSIFCASAEYEHAWTVQPFLAARLAAFTRDVMEGSAAYLRQLVETLLSHGVETALVHLATSEKVGAFLQMGDCSTATDKDGAPVKPPGNLRRWPSVAERRARLVADLRAFFHEKFVFPMADRVASAMAQAQAPLRDCVAGWMPDFLEHLHRAMPQADKRSGRIDPQTPDAQIAMLREVAPILVSTGSSALPHPASMMGASGNDVTMFNNALQRQARTSMLLLSVQIPNAVAKPVAADLRPTIEGVRVADFAEFVRADRESGVEGQLFSNVVARRQQQQQQQQRAASSASITNFYADPSQASAAASSSGESFADLVRSEFGFASPQEALERQSEGLLARYGVLREARENVASYRALIIA